MEYRELFPILSSRDLPRLHGFYRTVFDAEEVYRFPIDDSDWPIEYVGLRIGGSSLGIGRAPEAPGPEAGRGRTALWVYTDDCDAATDRARAYGARIIDGPTDQPWGERMSVIVDPDGNEIYIGGSG